jgi:hypothetical protein
MSTGTFSQAVRLANDAQSSRSVPHILQDRHIFTGHLFPFITDFFDVSEPNLGPGQQKFKMPGKIRSMVTHQLQPKLFGFGTMPTQFETSGAQPTIAADTDFTIAMVAVTGLRKYGMLRNRRTGAQIQVRSVSSLTVTARPWAGGTNGDGLDAILAGDKYDFVGYAYPDGATLITGNTAEPVERSNYLQFHVTETDIGMLAERRKLYPDLSNSHGTDELINAIQHNEGRERAFLFGEGKLGTLAGETLHTMKGLDAWSDVEWDFGGSLTMDEWRMVGAPKVFQSGGGGRKKAVAGNTVLSVWDNLLDGKVMVTNPGLTELNVRLKSVGAAAGIVDFMGSQPMNEREGEFFAYDPDLMTRLHMEGLDMTLMTDLAPNNVLKKTSGYFTCETLLVDDPDNIFKGTNVLA